MAFPWATFGLVFLLPFVDPRRPLRLLHLDLLVLGLAGAFPLRAFLFTGNSEGSAVSALVCLAYLAARLLWVGLKPGRRSEPLVPLVPATWLAVALVLIVAFRISYVTVDRDFVVDAGVAGVVGADLIGDGRGLYDGSFRGVHRHEDTYGPAVYLSYVPFEQALPYDPARFAKLEYPVAARIAAIAFDLLTLVGLVLL